jgi:CRP-like cAMP-binding protein
LISLSIFRNAETSTYKAGNIIFAVGEPGKVMYVVSEGEVEIKVGASVVESISPGSIFGEMALIDNSPRSATAVAKTDCKVVPLDQRRFQFLVQETPFFALQVMTIMANRLRNANSRIAGKALS